MGIQQFSDNATTTLAANISSTVTAMTVASSTPFPSISGGDWFVATLQQIVDGLVTAYEIVKVTAVSGANWTIVRAQEGTAALPWVSGNTVALLPTSGGLAQFLQRGDLFLITPAEAGITPTNYGYPEGDIRRYGALSGAFDNSTAINTALQVSANQGAAAYIPGGTWEISNPIIAYPGSSMHGAGPTNSVISVANGVDGLQFTTADSTYGGRFFRDFKILGTLNGTANNAHGVYAVVTSGFLLNILFENVAVINFEYGFFITNLEDSTILACFVQNCWNGIYFNNQSVNVSLISNTVNLVSPTTLITGPGYSQGVSVQGAPEVESLQLIANKIYGYDYNIFLGLIFECQIESNDISNSSQCPIYFTSVLGLLVIRDNWIELGAGASGVWNGGNANQVPGNLTGIFLTAITPTVNSKVQIVGNYIKADSALAGSTGVYLGNSNNGILIDGNQLFDFDVGIGGGNTLVNTGATVAGASIKRNTINANTSAILLGSSSTDLELGPNYIVGGTPVTFTAGAPASMVYTQPNVPMSGTASVSGATSVAVAFANPMPVATYRIALSPSAQSNPWWTAKTVNGFTINFSAAYTGSVDWSIAL